MPGGTLGQLTAVAMDHPKIDTTATTYIVGGTNDIKVSRDEEHFNDLFRTRMFTHTANSLFNIIKETTEMDNPPKMKYIITTPHEKDLTPEESLRKEYLVSGIKEIANEKETIDLIELSEDIETTVDGHPTVKGTGQIIDSFLGGTGVVIDPDVSLHPKPYRGVQRMWKAGCKVCRRVGVYDKYERCEDCLNTLTALIDSNSPIMNTWVQHFLALKQAREPPPTAASPADGSPPTNQPEDENSDSETPSKRMRTTSSNSTEASQADSPIDINVTHQDGETNQMET